MKYAILCLLISFIVVSADKCGGNCPSGKCPSCPCGTKGNSINIAEICKRHSWNQNCCACVVRGESGGNSNAMNYNKNGSYDIGIFQINQIHWKLCSGGKAPCDIGTNVGCAITVYTRAGGRWKPWYAAAKCGCSNSP